MITVSGRINSKREQIYKDKEGNEVKSFMLGIISEGDDNINQVKVPGDTNYNLGDTVKIDVRLYTGVAKVSGKPFAMFIQAR